ncbi:MAG: DUF362 domain-containing protein [Clostridia bacterium]|nr:DUF362 domain-containing protein [Clostridia bacterium]
MDRVSVLGCAEYRRELLDEVIERHFAALDAGGTLIRPGAKVMVKPNLIMRRRPEDSSTTHPEFLAAVIRAVQRRGGKCTIAESPGGPYTKAMLKSVYAGTGVEKVAQETGALLNYDVGTVTVPSKGGAVCSSFTVISPVTRVDLVISVAILKTHTMLNYSGAVKNLFGCVPGLMKPEFHYRFPARENFAQMIVDLCETVAPALSFVDGIVCMEGNGPTGGTPRFMGVTLAGCNPHALDLAASSLAGFSPDDAPTVKAAIGRGLCCAAVSQLDIVGDNYEKFALRGFKKPETKQNFMIEKLPEFIRRPLDSLLAPRPAIRRAACIGCGKCAESCPRSAIAIVGKKAQIDYSKCIKCYCCHEMCPEKSVDIKRMGLFGK